MSASKLWLKTNGLAESKDSLRQFPLLLKDRTQGVEGFRVIGFSANGSLQFGNCTLEVTLLPKRDSDSVKSVRLRWVEGFCLAKFRDSFGEFVLQLQSEPQVVVKSGVFRVTLESG